MENEMKILKMLKLVDDSNEINYTTLLALAAAVKLFTAPVLAVPDLLMLAGTLVAHTYQEQKRE